MAEKKNLMINCDSCDTRSIKEEDYTNYEQIVINCELMLVNERSKSVLARLPVTMNNDQMLELEDDEQIQVKTINGSAKISKNSAFPNSVFLVVNGSLVIEAGTEENVNRIRGIVVNGSVRYPESMGNLLTHMTVNGAAKSYPDGCILLDRHFVLDEYFPLRARQGARYYAEKEVIIKNAGLDAKKLQEKNVQFVTGRVLMPEELVEDAIALFDEQAELVVVPAGMRLVRDDAELTDGLIRQYGTKLFINGDLKLSESCENALAALEKLIVRGKVQIKSSQTEAFFKVDAEYGELEIIKGRAIANKLNVKVDRQLLENFQEGLSVVNTATVNIAEDVSAELILSRLALENCAFVSCSGEQESAVAAVSENVARIGGGTKQEEDGLMEEAMSAVKDLTKTKLINSDSYVM